MASGTPLSRSDRRIRQCGRSIPSTTGGLPTHRPGPPAPGKSKNRPTPYGQLWARGPHLRPMAIQNSSASRPLAYGDQAFAPSTSTNALGNPMRFAMAERRWHREARTIAPRVTIQSQSKPEKKPVRPKQKNETGKSREQDQIRKKTLRHADHVVRTSSMK